MSIETEITRISTNVEETLDAVSEMGGEVPEGSTSNDMATAVRTIPVGAKIDDTTPSATTTYSSSKIDALLNEQKEANAKQDNRLTALEQAGGISAPYLGELKRTAIYPCSTIYLDGDITGMTKENAVMLDIMITDEYGNEFFRGKSETAWQGQGSLDYPNKNLSLKLQDDAGEKAKINVFPDYATHSYHLKCNYLDYSMVRNSVGAQLAHDFDDTVFPVDAPLTVKSIPVIVYLNGVFNGCYTLNYKQDDKLFGMDTETNPLTEIVYRSGLGTWTQSNFEYRGDADETAEMQAKLKTMMDFAANSDDATFTAEFENHFDLNNAINYWLYADIACATDSMINNWTVATWDGAKWYMIWYDLDIIFGLMENAGNSIHPNAPSTDLLTLTYTTNNPIWAKLYRCFYEQIRERYWELREGIANPTALVSRFRTFQSKWSADNIAKERAKWTARPNTTKDVDAMYGWMTQRFAVLDAKYTSESVEPEEPVVTYTITNNLTYASNSNSATSVSENEAYAAQITANSGYELESVVVTMGGVDVTADVYADGSISIAGVTGNVVITATAVATETPDDGDDTGLPTGYTRVGYIESTGTQYVDTGKDLSFTDDDEFYLKFAITDNSTTQVAFGYGDAKTNNQLVIVNKKFRVDQKSQKSYTPEIVNNDIYEYSVVGSRIKIYGNMYTKSATITSGGSAWLFTKNNGAGQPDAKAKMRLYEMYYKADGVLTTNLIPVLDTSGVACLYDTVSGQTLYNIGSGEFSYGAFVPCTGITLDQNALTFTAAGTQTLTATVTPNDTTDEVVWTTSADTVATVSGGVVTAVGNGNATITATCGDYSATCTVNVNAFGVSLSEYEQVDYIESNGTQFVDTGVSGGTNATYEIKLNTLGKAVSTYEMYFAGQDDAQIPQIVNAGSNVISSIGSVTLFTQSDAIHVVEYKADGAKVYVDGVAVTSTAADPSGNGWGYAPWRVCGSPAETNLSSSMRLYYLKMWTDGELVRDFIPVKRISDGVYGLYDNITMAFYSSAGTGAFTGA